MTERQRRFVDEYMIDGNATQAALRAGYRPSSAQNASCRILRQPEVAILVEQGRTELSRRTGITAERVLRELEHIAFSRITDFIELRDGQLAVRDTAALPDACVAALAGVKQGVRGVELRLYDKQSALESLAKRLNLYTGGDEDGNARRMAALRDVFAEMEASAAGEAVDGAHGEDWEPLPDKNVCDKPAADGDMSFGGTTGGDAGDETGACDDGARVGADGAAMKGEEMGGGMAAGRKAAQGSAALGERPGDATRGLEQVAEATIPAHGRQSGAGCGTAAGGNGGRDEATGPKDDGARTACMEVGDAPE